MKLRRLGNASTKWKHLSIWAFQNWIVILWFWIRTQFGVCVYVRKYLCTIFCSITAIHFVSSSLTCYELPSLSLDSTVVCVSEIWWHKVRIWLVSSSNRRPSFICPKTPFISFVYSQSNFLEIVRYIQKSTISNRGDFSEEKKPKTRWPHRLFTEKNWNESTEFFFLFSYLFNLISNVTWWIQWNAINFRNR